MANLKYQPANLNFGQLHTDYDLQISNFSING